jgi:acylglycerol lipase
MRPWEGFRTASDGTKLFGRRWKPEGSPKGVVCFVHGVCEHSGRYERIAHALTAAGYAMTAFDLRGHGRTAGRRGDLRLSRAMTDIGELLVEERERAPSAKIFLYGQSLGGLLALAYALDHAPKPAGVIASAPVLHTALRKQRAKVAIARSIGRLFPRFSMRPGLDDTKLMRDDEVLANRRADTLVIDRVSAGLARDVLRATDHVLANGGRFPVPLLLVHGRADEVNFLSGSEELFAKVPGDKTLHVYDGVKHHPHNDPERARIFADVVAWLHAHV